MMCASRTWCRFSPLPTAGVSPHTGQAVGVRGPGLLQKPKAPAVMLTPADDYNEFERYGIGEPGTNGHGPKG